MPKKPLEAIIEEHFSKVNDPRIDRRKKHKLIDMIAIVICAVICDAEGWTDIENSGNSKLPWLKSFLELPNGTPSHDTFGRGFSRLATQQFQRAFYEWVWVVNEIVHGQIVNIDGERLADSEDKFLGKHAIYTWAEENEIVLVRRKVDEKP